MANESNAKNNEMKDFFAAHAPKIIFIVILVMAAVVGVIKYLEYKDAEATAQADLLGSSMSYLGTENNDKAIADFEEKINSGKLNGVALAKAALFVANAKLEKNDLDGAASLFQKSMDNAGSAALVRSGAMHGLASVKMEKADYAGAATLLEQFVNEFGKRTGNLQDRYQKNEPADEVPTVADAMWKLTLVYQQLGKNDKAKATAEKILKVYGDNASYADKAQKFLAE